LFVVTDLSSVWLVGDLYEQDFAGVQVGAERRSPRPRIPTSRCEGA
jgi:hypothetical protein